MATTICVAVLLLGTTSYNYMLGVAYSFGMREELFFIRAITEMVAEDLAPLKIEARNGGGTFFNNHNMNWCLLVRDQTDMGKELRLSRSVAAKHQQAWSTFRFWYRHNMVGHKSVQDANVMLEYASLPQNDSFNIPVEDFAHEETHLWFVAYIVRWCEHTIVKPALIDDPAKVIKSRLLLLNHPGIWRLSRREWFIKRRRRQDTSP